MTIYERHMEKVRLVKQMHKDDLDVLRITLEEQQDECEHEYGTVRRNILRQTVY